MISVRLCFILVLLITLLEILPISGFANQFRRLVHYSRVQRNLFKSSSESTSQLESQFPEEVWGLKLGWIVDSIRNNNAYHEKRDELMLLGFDYDSQSKYEYDIIKLGLIKYQEIHDNMLVPRIFVVPIDSVYPEEIWGVKLGRAVENIRNNQAYAEMREELTVLGFDFKPPLKYEFDFIKIALLKYIEMNNNMLVPRVFIVPVGSIDYPEEVWGMKLGTVVYNIRNDNAYIEHKDELLSTGFDYESQKFGYYLIKIALLQYQRIHGDMLVPQRFIVPDDTE
mmetsp:Transcript_36147/g.34194  ORF Transcript_36147/g.34194 Transcript_36147/m.34194 type:complete len:282 (-) Transcript_36147:330-1175(-)|eukprot:CAMPEP_0119052268 /NCGR_PEP_ID=MMETSP1177-20130426/73622_1 /TAXON_ID=2985 /ORGANISM="Ochromonas sp, Strain CCMP1899" /LENGTH=281 /DNA_ID=CAMNT_0007031781 /DNA_START=67 /DNA_END=912 /DNA_ORIENTATION=-